MNSDNAVTFQWHGAAHYHISHKDLKIVIDPLYTRLPGDKPHLTVTKDDIDRIDYLLLTHGHLDHSWDFPYLVARHSPEAYAPKECLLALQNARPGSGLDTSKHHALEDIKGKSFTIAGIEVTPYQIGTEEIDFWFIRSMFIRPWVHGKPWAIPAGIRWLTHHLFCNCFAYHFRFPHPARSMLYFGNLTGQVDELGEIERVNVLAIPYCPANRKWLQQSQSLIERFRPDVTMVHHFDNFLNPYTLSKYMNLDSYRNAIHEKCPTATFYFSRFCEKVDLTRIAGA